MLANLNKLANEIVVQNNYNFNVKISYIKHESVLMSGKVYTKDGRIEINLNRIKAISELNLNCFDKDFKQFIDGFAKKYENRQFRKTDATKCLYFSIKNRPINFVYEVGSYKTLKYDLFLTIIHEIQHMVQYSYEIKQVDKKSFSEDELYYTFLIFLDDLNKQNNFTDDNFYRPIELNARLTSATALNDYKRSKKVKDKFLSAIIKNSILYQPITTQEYATKIKEDFNNLSQKSDFKSDIVNLINKNWHIIQPRLANEFDSAIKLKTVRDFL